MRGIIQPNPKSKDLILTSLPLPTINPSLGEHLIRVKACAPCAGELLWPNNFPPPTPRELIPCPDVAGTIISGPEDSPFQPGDEVYARTNYNRPSNARDFTIGVTDELAHKPKSLSWIEAAAIPVSAETAWQILFIHAGIAGDGEADFATAQEAWKGKRVLVTAASGGVGMWVVQLATLLGAEVIGTCGAANVTLVQSLGAKEVLDYRRTSLREWAEQPGKKVDVVIDCIGRQSLEDAWWTIRDGGAVLSIFQPPKQVCPEGYKGTGVKDVFFVMEPVRRHLEEITKLVELGKCHGMVDSVWPLEQYQEAFKRLDEGHARGKIIFDLSLNN
ncbi:NAD(P)-binding protein [Penicillium argentinense]|uniref:NAD(P)-binding protein n=1 Tax=Penicillium argentinense TaxID=1131581 RepID=A0A9W9KMP9_9EURO|nr:NAD(P)-binding protein [Penicillium argentinense]KAJ5111178.1 NAD(P)-binding protein [Penicillium argentinense]